GEAHQLVAEADAEYRDLGRVEDLADRLDRVIARLGIAGAVGEENTIGLHAQDVARGRLRRDHGHARAALGDQPQDVVLDAVVVSDDVEARVFQLAVAGAQFPAPLGPFVRLVGGHHLGEVHAGEAGERLRLRERLLDVDISGQAAVLRALLPQDARQLAGIQLGDAYHLVFL